MKCGNRAPFSICLDQYPTAIVKQRSESAPIGYHTKQGEVFDFQVIHDRFRPRISRYLTRLIGAQDAEDLTQVVMLRVSAGMAEFRGESSLSTWIYRVATNAALDLLRSRSCKPAARCEAPSLEADTDNSEEFPVSFEPQSPSLETNAIRAEMNACIRGFVERLPEPYGTVIVLSELEGFKNREIAEILGTSLDTVKIRLHRAREQLKRALAAGCNFSRDERNELACERKRLPAKVS